jgi:hypothetical protein
MTAANWPQVAAIYAAGIATGTATFEQRGSDARKPPRSSAAFSGAESNTSAPAGPKSVGHLARL